MTRKQHAMTLIRPWPEMNSLKELLHEFKTRCKRAVEIPTGYQDEQGFHFGVEPKKDSQWPPR